MPLPLVDWSATLPGPDLPVGEVHLWKARTDVEVEYRDILAADEIERAQGFKLEEHRRRWVAARVLLRLVLGRYLEATPESVVLESGARGRPVVLRPGGSEWLCFSPSRSGDVALVALASGMKVGVDVERIRGGLDFVAIARRAFGDQAAEALAAEPDQSRTAVFFREWVREEARGKCRGTGLVEPDDVARLVPLHVVDLDLEDGYAGALAVDERVEVLRGCSAEW